MIINNQSTTNTKYSRDIFKAYDIRGVVATELTLSVVEDIGKVLGLNASNLGVEALVVGYDGRLTSSALADSLVKGILSVGCNVYLIGEVTTPMVYFANYFLKTKSGIMITGSHNPPEYNGLKMVLNGDTLFADKIQDIYHKLQNDISSINQNINNNYYKKAILTKVDITEDYVQKIISDVKISRPIKVIVDCGNGVAGKIAPYLYTKMGADVVQLYCNVDGNFPNHHPDPSKLENLSDLITELGCTDAEVGLAFDGDGDRLGVVTKEGNIIYPDRQLMLFAIDLLSKNPNANIIYDIKSSGLLNKLIKDYGGNPILCRTGHSFIKQKIQETNSKLAGEMSGHIFFNDRWFGFDDGVYAGARLLEILTKTTECVSTVLNNLPNSISTPELNIATTSGLQHEIIKTLQQNITLADFVDAIDIIDIDGIRVEYAYGFGLVRASNTTSVLVLRFEATNLELLNKIKSEFKTLLIKYSDITNIDF